MESPWKRMRSCGRSSRRALDVGEVIGGFVSRGWDLWRFHMEIFLQEIQIQTSKSLEAFGAEAGLEDFRKQGHGGGGAGERVRRR